MTQAIVQQELQALETFVKVLVQNDHSISDGDAADVLDSGYSWLESIRCRVVNSSGDKCVPTLTVADLQLFLTVPLLSVYKNLNNSLHSVRNHGRIFVPGHNRFREANTFPRA